LNAIRPIYIDFADISDLRAYRNFAPHSKYIDPNRIKRKIKGKEIILAKNGNDMVGLLKFTYFWSTRPYIEFIFVNENLRGMGIGRQLLDFLEHYLIENEYAYVFSSSEEKDSHAISWHKRNGFKEMGVLKDLNLPHDDTAEIFFSKKISDVGKLREYEI
jgi:L-amino acid N-acyltransferase YncA